MLTKQETAKALAATRNAALAWLSKQPEHKQALEAAIKEVTDHDQI